MTMPYGSPGMPPDDPGNVMNLGMRMAPPSIPRNSVPRNMNPQGRTSGAQKQMLALLASLVLNRRLRQGQMNQPPPMGQPNMQPGRMADLAQMQLNSSGGRPGY